MTDEQHGRALTAVLAECAAISALIDRKALTITTLVTFNITAAGTVVGFILSGKADKARRRRGPHGLISGYYVQFDSGASQVRNYR